MASLGSGSRGNGTLLATPATVVLVDCGFSLRDCLVRLARAEVDPATVDALLVTHEHADHIRGVAALANRFAIPVHATRGTLRTVAGLVPDLARPVDADVRFAVGDLDVLPVTVPHDAREPVQYVFDHGATRVGVLTDIGHLTPHVIAAYSGCHGLFLESNHDGDMLWNGSYPLRLKRRVGGDFGHLSNGQAVEFLQRLGRGALTHLVVGHVSEQNNERHRIEVAFAPFQAQLEVFRIADQAAGVDWIAMGSRR